MSFGIFYIAREYMHVPENVVQSFIFLKLVIAGHSTIYVTRTERHFWQRPFPSPILFFATTGTEIVATIIAVNGWFLTAIKWEYVLLVWTYALAWFVVNDFIKVRLYKLSRRDKAAITG